MRNNDETLWVFKSKGEVPVLLNWKTPHFSDSCNFFPWQYHLTVACVTFCNMFFNKISNECKLRASVCFTWCAYPSSNSTWNPPSPHSFRWLKLSWVGVATFATSWNRESDSQISQVYREGQSSQNYLYLHSYVQLCRTPWIPSGREMYAIIPICTIHHILPLSYPECGNLEYISCKHICT